MVRGAAHRLVLILPGTWLLAGFFWSLYCALSRAGCGSGPSCSRTWPTSRLPLQPERVLPAGTYEWRYTRQYEDVALLEGRSTTTFYFRLRWFRAGEVRMFGCLAWRHL